MVTVTLPYATRSREGRKLEQACADAAETVKYAIDHATDTRQRTRLAIDFAAGSYTVETAAKTNDADFEPLEDNRLGTRCLGPGVQIIGHEGFDVAGRGRYCIAFDPRLPWPRASLTLAVKDACMTIRIAGRVVDVEGQSD
jgi:hypothetical protein